MSENVLLSECLDAFFESLGNDTTVPAELIECLKQLHADGKLAKGNNLKNALTEYELKLGGD